MSRTVNLISVLEAKESLSSDAFDAFKAYHGFDIKPEEMKDLNKLCAALLSGGLSVDQFENFYLGYKIQQIGKEFDLLKFNDDTILNIEIKRKSTADKVLAQLKRNKYYLGFTNRKMHSFTFLADTGQVHTIDAEDKLCLASVDELVSAIKSVSACGGGAIDSVFNPSDYLVSPFNSTEKFLGGKYFLTGHQEQIVKSIVAKIDRGVSFSSISGGPGTGKSLLVYDLAKTAISAGRKVLIVHCGNLNSGQIELNEAGFVIIPVKKTGDCKDQKYDLIIVDEAQRIRKEQFDILISKSKADGIPCVFSHDERQTLARSESESGISKKLKAAKNVEKYELSEKIRSNAEISDFIKVFINKNRALKVNCSSNITISFFANLDNALDYWRNLPLDQWKRLRLTPSRLDLEHHEKFYDGEGETSHNVIGQEFDGVAILVDDMFAYDSHGDLIYKEKSYYDPVKMIFQNITRTRKRINVVVVNNEEIMSHCIKVLA